MRGGPAAATSTTGACRWSSRGWAGRCASTGLRPHAGRDARCAPGRGRRRGRRSRCLGAGDGAPRPAGCGSSYSCTCRWAARPSTPYSMPPTRCWPRAVGRGGGSSSDHGLPADRVRVAVPGVDRGPRVTGSASGGNLLCVGPVTSDKGYDVLLDALHEVRDLDWRCRCVGAARPRSRLRRPSHRARRATWHRRPRDVRPARCRSSGSTCSARRPTSSCRRRGGSPSAWRRPRAWPAGSR